MKFPAPLRLSALLVFAAFSVRVSAADASSTWQQPASAGVTLTSQPDGKAQIVSTVDEFVIDSVASLPAKVGDAFAIEVRTRVGIDMNAQPELACFDAQGREIPPPTPPPTTRQSTTLWQKFSKTFVAWPGTATVRARVRTFGRGTVLTEALVLRPTEIDTYQTGALVARPHPRTRSGILLESNFGIVNRELVSTADRDGDGKWALVVQDLDKLTQPEQKGDDWRSNFEDNPNVILWTDGAVLKSDSVVADRAPDAKHALHFRMKVHPGPYTARLNDPGRPVAVSLDGKTWRRGESGEEIDLGTIPAADGVVEVWVDACYADKIKTGPAYFDYVRLLPTMHAPDIERLFAAAKKSPPQLTRGTADETKVPVTINAPAFSALKEWPARCGLPVPQGELVAAENIAVFDATGRAIPSQNRITAKWPDGSAKWIFVDFMYDPSRVGVGNFTVVYGNRVKATAAPKSVSVQKTSAGLEVNTGAIQFLVSGSKFGLIENVRNGGGQPMQRGAIEAEIVEAEGKIWNARDVPVAKIEVEQAGPLHTVVLVETRMAESGKPAAGFYHRARIHAYADSPLVEIDYFVANTDSRPAKNVGGSMASKVAVKSFALKLRPDNPIMAVHHEAGAGPTVGSRVQKTEDVVCDIRGNETPGRLAGWLGLALGRGQNLQLGLADFRETFPKALRWNGAEVNIDLWANEGGPFDWIEGIGKTHHVAFVYAEGTPVDGSLLAAGPVLATAAPEWYVRSRALGPIITAAESALPDVEQGLNTHMNGPVIDRVGLGFENYGDHTSGGYVKGNPLWDNNEYDLPAACMVHFARTGNRAALKLGLASAQHYLDVDTIHYSSQHADWARAQRVHSHATFGHHSAQGPDFNHAGYVQGLIWHSYLLGEPTGIAGARGIADWAVRKLTILTTGMERLVGHALMTCNDTYEATGEDKYLRASAALVDQCLKWEHPIRSGFLARIFETPAFYSGCPFDNGVISAGLIKFNEWAKQPEIDAMLVRFAQWTLTDTWMSPLGLASKGGSPRKGGGSAQHIGNQGRLMSYAYGVTHDPFYVAVPSRLTVAGFGAGAKPIFGTRSTGLVYNYLPWLLATLHEQGDPQPEPQIEVIAPREALAVASGARVVANIKLRNTGSQPIEDLRMSLHSRRDVAIKPLRAAPTRIDAGATVECEYEIVAPAQVNLSCDYNRIAHAHWSALYRRSTHAHFAHQPIKVVIGGASAGGSDKAQE
jgi:hypothetical protein